MKVLDLNSDSKYPMDWISVSALLRVYCHVHPITLLWCNMRILSITHLLVYISSLIAYWIAQRAVKMVYDHVDGLQLSPHDVTTIQDRMNDYFKVCATVPVC